MTRNSIRRNREYPNYTEPQPSLSGWTYLWLAAVIVGVVGLGFIAYASMRKQGFEMLPAVCFAFLIEVGTFGAGWNLVRGNKATLFEIVVGIITSGLYNYAHIRAINVQAITKVADTDWLLLGVYGVGPLLIAFSAALWVGREMHVHDLAVTAWCNRARADQEARQVRAKQEEDERAEKQRIAEQQERDAERKLAAQKEIQLAQIAAQKEVEQKRIEQDAEVKKATAQAEEGRKAQVAQARIEAKLIAQEGVQSGVQLHRMAAQATYEDFAQAIASNGTHEWSGALIAKEFNVSRRTGNYWLEKWRKEHPQPVETSEN